MATYCHSPLAMAEKVGVRTNLRETPWVAWLAFGWTTSLCWPRGHLRQHKQMGRDKLG